VSPASPAEPLPETNLLLTPQSTLLVFARRPEQPITKDPRSIHRAVLRVSTRDLGERPVKTLQEYLAYEQSRTSELAAHRSRLAFACCRRDSRSTAACNRACASSKLERTRALPSFPEFRSLRGFVGTDACTRGGPGTSWQSRTAKGT